MVSSQFRSTEKLKKGRFGPQNTSSYPKISKNQSGRLFGNLRFFQKESHGTENSPQSFFFKKKRI